jgi:hypothetical protein
MNQNGAKTAATNGACQSCRFFVLHLKGGRCHRNPPVFWAQNAISIQPSVQADDWCGEYSPAARRPNKGKRA